MRNETFARLCRLSSVLVCVGCGGVVEPTAPMGAASVGPAPLASALEPALVDPCGPGEAGATVEDASKSWRLGLDLLSEGKADAARCPFELATRTLERVSGTKVEQVVFGELRPRTVRAGLGFYDVQTLARVAGGELLSGHALFGMQRVEGSELEPILSLAGGAEVVPWPGVPGGFAVAGKPSRVFRSPTDWTDLSHGSGVALDPSGRLALVCDQQTLTGHDVTTSTAPASFSKASRATCRFGRFAAQGRLYAEESSALLLETSTGEEITLPEDVVASALSPSGETLALASVRSEPAGAKLMLELRSTADLTRPLHSAREVATLPPWGGGTVSVLFDGAGDVLVIWQPVQAVNTYPDAETLAKVDVKTGAVKKHPKRILPWTGASFDQLAKPFKARLEKGKRVIVPPAPHDVTYDVSGATLAVLTTGEIVAQSWGPIVKDLVLHVVDPSRSKVLHTLPLPSSEPSRISVSLGPKGRGLVACASALGGFLVDVKSGNIAALEDGAGDFACEYGTTIFSDDGERVYTRAGLAEVGRLGAGPATTPAFIERVRGRTSSAALARAKSDKSFAEAEAAGQVYCRFGPILTPGEVCAARFR